MNRYVSSFGIAVLPYLFGLGLYAYMQSIAPSLLEPKTTPQAMAIQISYLPPKTVEPVIKEPEAKVEEPKELPIIEEKPAPNPLKVKKKIVQKKLEQPNEQTVQAPVVMEKIVPSQEKKDVVSEKSVETKMAQETLHVKKVRYLSELKNRIDTNKSYPRLARERNIEGCVVIEFTISPEGNLIAFTIIEGKQVFHKSVKEAIIKSFPFPMPEPIFASNLTIQLTIEYALI